MPREPKLDMLPDKDMKLSGAHFRKVVRRIESIVPLAGFSIKTEDVDGGIKLHLDAERVTLNVCSNGTPSTIVVYAYAAPTLSR
jgi:hypothetical protein